jgi:predicted ester cyclase
LYTSKTALSIKAVAGDILPLKFGGAMTTEDRKVKLRKAFEDAYHRGDFATLEEIASADLVDNSVYRDPNAAKGLAGFEQRLSGTRAAFPDIKAEFGNFIAEGDFVAFNWSLTGTNTGSLRGAPPTGKTMTMTGINIERYSGDKIVEHWSNPDLLAMMQQLGLIPSPGAK